MTAYHIGFTGHREGVAPEPVSGALRRVLAQLTASGSQMHYRTELHTGAAAGADLLCIRVARALSLPVHILLPLREDEFQSDFADPSEWAAAVAEIGRSRSIPGHGSVRAAGDGQPRPQCYVSQMVRLLEEIDLLVAVWDGKLARGPGGTAEVVARARLAGRPVILIDPVNGTVAEADTARPPATSFSRAT